MLSARDLTLRRGAEPLFEHVNFTVFRGERVGLTGANGTGKSSLFAAICGDLAPDGGDLEFPASLKIAHVEQEVSALDRPAIEFVLDGDVELRRVTAAIEDAERRDAAMELAELHASLDAIDGYRAGARAASIMHGLGFESSQHERKVAEFSGGWRVRLSMARALNSRADLLLLDEPTNHLDLDAIVWLEEWLAATPSTLMIVSHDREFLDAVIGRVLHIENRGIRAYSGNYTAFEQKRSEDLALQQALKARQVRRIAEISSFVNRFRAQATKARQAQSRLKMLEKMERIVPAHVDSPFEFEFSAAAEDAAAAAQYRRRRLRLWRARGHRRHQCIHRPAGSDRSARTERRRQVHLDENAGGRDRCTRRPANPGGRPGGRLLRAAATGTAHPHRGCVLAHA